MGFNIAKIGVN